MHFTSLSLYVPLDEAPGIFSVAAVCVMCG